MRAAQGEGDTALHVAAYRGHLKAMEALLEGGASLLLANKVTARRSALHSLRVVDLAELVLAAIARGGALLEVRPGQL